MKNFEKYSYLLSKNKDFQKLFYAKFITYMGDWFLTVPLLSIIYEITNSPLITSIVLVVQSAPYVILGSFGGFLADKFDRKVVISISEFLSGCAVLLIMYSVSTENVVFILLSFSLLGVVNCAYMPASDAALPNVVSRDNLPEANVLNFSTWGIAAGLGAGLGGFLSEFLSRNQLFTINFLSFMFSAFLVFLIKTNLSENILSTSENEKVKFKDGLNFVLSDKKIFYLTITKGMFGISAAGLLSLFTILSLEVYDTGDLGAGLMWSARGIGAFIGPVLFRYLFGKTDQKLLSTIGPSKLEMTRSLRPSIKVGCVFKAFTLLKLTIPAFSAISLYSISISCKVSICSPTKLIGTTIKSLTFDFPRSVKTSSV